jgi:hypothetical protein
MGVWFFEYIYYYEYFIHYQKRNTSPLGNIDWYSFAPKPVGYSRVLMPLAAASNNP